MSDQIPLYNSRLYAVYLQYLRKYYPAIDPDSILQDAGIAKYEIEDPSHWFSQEQSNRFYDSVVARTGNPNIAREAGRYTASSANLGATKQYVAGLISPTTTYFLMEKLYALWSRGADIRTRKIGSKPGGNNRHTQTRRYGRTVSV